MNPRHDSRIIRVVSGDRARNETKIGRSGEKLRLAKPHSFMAQEIDRGRGVARRHRGTLRSGKLE